LRAAGFSNQPAHRGSQLPRRRLRSRARAGRNLACGERPQPEPDDRGERGASVWRGRGVRGELLDRLDDERSGRNLMPEGTDEPLDEALVAAVVRSLAQGGLEQRRVLIHRPRNVQKAEVARQQVVEVDRAALSLTEL